MALHLREEHFDLKLGKDALFEGYLEFFHQKINSKRELFQKISDEVLNFFNELFQNDPSENPFNFSELSEK